MATTQKQRDEWRKWATRDSRVVLRPKEFVPLCDHVDALEAEVERLRRLCEQGGICVGCGNAARACLCPPASD